MTTVQGRSGGSFTLRFATALGVTLTLAMPARAREESTSGDCLVLRFEGAWDPNHSAAIAIDLHTASARRRIQICPVGVESTGRILVLSAAEITLENVTLSLDTEQGETLTRRISLEEVPADGRVFAIVIAGDELLRASKQQPDRAVRQTEVAVASPSSSVPAAATKQPRRSSTPPPRSRVQRRTSEAISLALASELYAEGQTHLGPDVQWQHSLTTNVFGAIALSGRRGLGVGTASGVVESKLLGARAAAGYTVFARRGLSLSLDTGARLGRIWFDATAHGSEQTRRSSGWVVYADALASVGVQTRSAFAARFAVGLGIPLLSQAAVDGRHTITAAGGFAAEAHSAVVWTF